MKYQNLKSFEKHLESASPDHLCRVYLIAIPDDFERGKILDLLAKRLSPSGSSVQRVSPEGELCELFDALQSPSLFESESVVLLDSCEALKKNTAETLSQFLEKTACCGYLLLGAKGKTPLAKIAEKVGVVLDFSEEKPWEKEKRICEALIEMARKEKKRLSADAPALLFERLGMDMALLTQEVFKLICYVGDRPTIERSDVFQISASSLTPNLWQMAEEIVWEGKGAFDASTFPAILFSLRSQLQVGLKMAVLMEQGIPSHEWTPFFSKMWPKTLEKRKEQTSKKGALYFKKGLETLLKIESLSRSGSAKAESLFDLFRTSLKTYEKR